MKRKQGLKALAVGSYVLFVLASLLFGFPPGQAIGHHFLLFARDMLKVLPCAFVLIGLFEVWVKRETVEKHFGEGSGFRGYVGAILLAGTTVGGLYVAFPVAHALYTKGAKLSVIFSYVGASAICRVPMTLFEASFMGLKFTLIRLSVSLPLVIGTSILLGNALTKRGYRLTLPD